MPCLVLYVAAELYCSIQITAKLSFFLFIVCHGEYTWESSWTTLSLKHISRRMSEKFFFLFSDDLNQPDSRVSFSRRRRIKFFFTQLSSFMQGRERKPEPSEVKKKCVIIYQSLWRQRHEHDGKFSVRWRIFPLICACVRRPRLCEKLWFISFIQTQSHLLLFAIDNSWFMTPHHRRRAALFFLRYPWWFFYTQNDNFFLASSNPSIIFPTTTRHHKIPYRELSLSTCTPCKVRLSEWETWNNGACAKYITAISLLFAI